MTIHMLPTLSQTQAAKLQERTGRVLSAHGELIHISEVIELADRIDLKNLLPARIVTVHHHDTPTPPTAA